MLIYLKKNIIYLKIASLFEEKIFSPMLREVKQVILPPNPHWVGNGFYVHGFFDNFENENSPFLLLDYAAPRYFAPSKANRGVGNHPHKGFETVSIGLKGRVEHADNKGNSGIVGEGGVQWMTAGNGIIHSEFLEKEFNESGGDFSFVQIWVNLPSEDKLVKPRYQAFTKSEIPLLNVGENKVSLIAGEFENTFGVASTFSPINLFTVDINSVFKFTQPSKFTTMILVISGSFKINGLEVSESNLVIFGNIGEEIEVNPISKDGKILVLSGEPLNEPIAHYGPFVMNTEAELFSTINDFNSGNFGKI